jgi:acyl-CoA synthetase (AMP-forming)/AMP-acid ligase II
MSDTYQTIRLQRFGAVALLIFARPQRLNAIDRRMLGELQHPRTPFVMGGCLDEPELTRAAFAGGLFRTGDLARTREDGRTELAGRIKDLKIRGGGKVSPLELDHVLVQHPAVAAALTNGVPDSVMGERIHALVVLRADAKIEEKDLREWIAGRIEDSSGLTSTTLAASFRQAAPARLIEARYATKCSVPAHEDENRVTNRN